MKATQVEQGLYNTSTFKLFNELGERGGEIITRINSDEPFRKRIAAYMLNGAPEMVINPPPSQHLTVETAIAIMGKDRVHGPEVVEQVFNSTVQADVWEKAKLIPYTSATLGRYAQTHILVYGCAISIKDIAKNRSFGIRWRLPQDNHETFKTSLPTQGWYLISRGPEGPEIGTNERLASVADIYYALALHKRVNNRHYFYDRKVARCLETNAGGEVYFGLGTSFVPRYTNGSYDYWVIKELDQPRNETIRVVLPDNPI